MKVKAALATSTSRSLIACIALALGTHASSAQRSVRRADIDSTGQLRIVFSDQRVIAPAKDSGQVAFEQLALSSNHRIVGWVALYPNCCTTYPIPLKLLLLRAGGGRTVIGNGLPIWQWAFAADGRSVVIRTAPVHGDAPTYYERREIRTGRVIATVLADAPPAARCLRGRAQCRGEPPSPYLSNECSGKLDLRVFAIRNSDRSTSRVTRKRDFAQLVQNHPKGGDIHRKHPFR